MKRTFLLIGTLLLTAGSAFAYSMPRWGMTSVDVYLPEHQYSDMVRSTFEEWADASGNRMRFRFASTRFASTNAPIKVEFVDQKAPFYLTRSKRNETTGYFTNMDQGFINRATLTIHTKDKENKTPNQTDLKGQIRADVGYILGLTKIYGDCKQANTRSAMCIPNDGAYSSITDKDIEEITKKYDRSNDDIKERKHKK